MSSAWPAGVGVNTRTGTARFIITLQDRLPPAALQKPAGDLLKALVGALRAEASGAMRKAFASAVGALVKAASAKRVQWVVAQALEIYTEGARRTRVLQASALMPALSGGISTARWRSPACSCAPAACAAIRCVCADKASSRITAGLLLQQVVRHAGGKLEDAVPTILPVAFSARWDQDADVKAAWQDVWSELGSSESSVLTLHGEAVTAPLVAGLQADAWERRAVAAKVFAAVAASSGAALVPHAPKLMHALLAELPGRIWSGKEAVALAVGALAGHCSQVFTSDGVQQGVSDSDIVSTLVAAAERRNSKFAAAAADALAQALGGFEGRDHLLHVMPLLDAANVGADEDSNKPDKGELCLVCSCACGVTSHRVLTIMHIQSRSLHPALCSALHVPVACVCGRRGCHGSS
jgi:proteasome component ECM29